MTEERIREIFSLYAWEIQIIKTVAAEARKEGIEEAWNVVEQWGVEHEIVIRKILELQKQIERLKEKKK